MDFGFSERVYSDNNHNDVSVTVSLLFCHFCQDEMSVLRRRLEKSEKERNELRQTADSLETKVCLVTQTHLHTHMHTNKLML